MSLWKSKNTTGTVSNTGQAQFTSGQTALQNIGGTLTPGNVTWIGPMKSNAQSWAASGIALVPPATFQGYSYSAGTVYPVWPWDGFSLGQQEMDLIIDFKTRHPDFDTYVDEINLVLKHRPGLKNTPLFISLLYEMAKEIRVLIQKYTEEEKVEEILNGKTQETNRTG